MNRVVTLVAPSAIPDFAGITESARAVLTAGGASVGPTDWLSPGQACDLPFVGGDLKIVEAALHKILHPHPIDVAVQEAAGRRKALLFADLESTIIRQELLIELGKIAGIADRIAAITERAMLGDIGFADALRERVGLLAGLPVQRLAEVRDEIELMPGARALVATMRHRGARAVLATGGFAEFAAAVGAACGFDEVHCNRLEIRDDRLTGRLRGPIIDADGKHAHLVRACAAAGRTLDEAVAVGDGANDIPMLRAAGMGVAYHGKPAVRAAARYRVDHADLTALLYYQGYRHGEFRD
ncbi:MAG: phosphoserine phosphatase SerB [Dongiaceae bacterium]